MKRWLDTKTLKEELDYVKELMGEFIKKAVVHDSEGKTNPFVKVDIDGASITFDRKELKQLVKDITNGWLLMPEDLDPIP